MFGTKSLSLLSLALVSSLAAAGCNSSAKDSSKAGLCEKCKVTVASTPEQRGKSTHYRTTQSMTCPDCGGKHATCTSCGGTLGACPAH